MANAKIHAVAPNMVPTIIGLPLLSLLHAAAYLLNSTSALPAWVPAQFTKAATDTANYSSVLFGVETAPTVMFYVATGIIAAHILEAIFVLYKIATSGVPVKRVTVYVHYLFAVLVLGFPQTGPALAEISRAKKAKKAAKKD